MTFCGSADARMVDTYQTNLSIGHGGHNADWDKEDLNG